MRELLWSDGITLYPNCADHYINLLHVTKFYKTLHQINYVSLQVSRKQENLYLHSLFVFTDSFMFSFELSSNQ